MRHRTLILGIVIPLSTAASAFAQVREPLFDTFKFEASWVRTTTTIRLDSERLGEGTTLSFEDDLGLPDKKAVPSLSFESSWFKTQAKKSPAAFFCKSCTFPALCQGEEKFFSGAFRFTVPGPGDDPFSRVEFCPENDI